MAPVEAPCSFLTKTTLTRESGGVPQNGFFCCCALVSTPCSLLIIDFHHFSKNCTPSKRDAHFCDGFSAPSGSDRPSAALGPLLGRQDDVQIHSGFLLFRDFSGLSLRRRAPDIARLTAGVADAASWSHPARKSGALVEAPCTFLIKMMLS